MKFTFNYSAIIFVILSASSAQATIQFSSEYQLSLPNAVIDSLVLGLAQKTWAPQQLRQARMNFTTPYKISLENIVSHVAPKRISATSLTSGRQWLLSAKDLNVKIQIDKFILNDRVERIIGGVKIITRLNAQCEQIVVSLAPGAGEIQIESQLYVRPSQLSVSNQIRGWQWSPEQWQIDIGACKAPAGFEGVLREQIAQVLNNRSLADPLLMKILLEAEGSLNQQLGEWSKSIPLQFPQAWVKSNVRPQIFSIAKGDQLTVSGQVDMSIENNGSHIQLPLLQLKPADIPTQANQGALILPKEFVNHMVHSLYQAQKLNYEFSLRQIPAFVMLMESWFAKLFVWSDLLYFPSDQDFIMTTVPSSEPLILWESEGLSAKVRHSLAGTMWYWDDNQYRSYQDWYESSDQGMSLTVNDGELKIVFAQPEGLALAANFTPEYLAMRAEPGQQNIDTIRDSFADFLSDYIYTYKLPPLTLIEGMNFKLQSIERQQDNLVIMGSMAK